MTGTPNSGYCASVARRLDQVRGRLGLGHRVGIEDRDRVDVGATLVVLGDPIEVEIQGVHRRVSAGRVGGLQLRDVKVGDVESGADGEAVVSQR